jgi:hypothetical protein
MGIENAGNGYVSDPMEAMAEEQRIAAEIFDEAVTGAMDAHTAVSATSRLATEVLRLKGTLPECQDADLVVVQLSMGAVTYNQTTIYWASGERTGGATTYRTDLRTGQVVRDDITLQASTLVRARAYELLGISGDTADQYTLEAFEEAMEQAKSDYANRPEYARYFTPEAQPVTIEEMRGVARMVTSAEAPQ